MYPESCFEISKDIKEKNLYIVWTVTVCFRIERFLARDAFTHTYRTGQMLSACNFLCTIGIQLKCSISPIFLKIYQRLNITTCI